MISTFVDSKIKDINTSNQEPIYLFANERFN